MSSETLERIETVEIDLSERGLTELAKMLVQSGRMSAPSFTNWCSRVSPQASRWARADQVPSRAGKAKGKKPNNDGSSRTTPKDESRAGKPVGVKDAHKLSGFKKAWPDVNVKTWKEVLGASEALKRTWMTRHKMIMDVQDRKTAAQTHLAGLNLSEEELRHSRAWFPLFPGDDNKELYDSITTSAETPQQSEDTVPSNTGPALKTGDKETTEPSNAWEGGSPKLVIDQTGSTGTSQQFSYADIKLPQSGSKNKQKGGPKKGKR
jgi:hypothetical protein